MAFLLLNASHLGKASSKRAGMLCKLYISTSHGGLNDVTCHVRVQYISKGCKMLLDLQAHCAQREDKTVYCMIKKLANPC